MSSLSHSRCLLVCARTVRFTKAAEQGNASAQCNLGTSYLNGEGVAQDIEQAARWVHKAAAQGADLAIKALPRIHGICSGCMKENTARSRCARCKVVHYCGPACQRAHWKAGHKRTCTPCE